MSLEDLKVKRKQMQADFGESETKTVGEIEELRKKRQHIRENSEAVLNSMQIIADESTRVAEVAHDSRRIIQEIDDEFERQTSLNKTDFAFLFFATALQVARIGLINQLTTIESAGKGELEESLKRKQKKILSKFDNGEQKHASDFYAPLNQIILIPGVPYDVTQYENEKYGIFDGANHRFATVGHDPLLGLVFGTANILTNTITSMDQSLIGFGRKGHVPRDIPIGNPIIKSNHVRYTEKSKDKIIGRGLDRHKETTLSFSSPKIGEYCSTLQVLKCSADRIQDDTPSVVAAVIKQIIHIGTDLYTPCGIQFPGANIVFSNDLVETMTKYVSTGDIIKVGASAGFAALINLVIGTLHGLTFDETKYGSRGVYAVKTRKILMWSNTIATGSNLIWIGANVVAGDKSQIKNMDIGGLLITMHRLIHDPEFIRKVKEEFVFGKFNKMIQGEPLELKEIKAWD